MSDFLITEDGTILDAWDTGIEYLSKVVVNNLFNTIMSALYSPEFGTDIKSLPQTNIDKGELEMKFTMLVNEIETKIKEEQLISPQSLDEMLDRIVIKSLVMGTDKRWKAYLRVYSQAQKYLDLKRNLT